MLFTLTNYNSLCRFTYNSKIALSNSQIKMFHSSKILKSNNNNLNNSNLNISNDVDSDYTNLSNRFANLAPIPSENDVGVVENQSEEPREASTFESIQDSFAGVNEDDPFFGLIPKW